MSNDIQLYMHKPENIQRFVQLLGGVGQANRYVEDVIIAWQSDPKLQECSVESAFTAALRAARNNLSVDPIMKEAQLIPRKVKEKMVVSFEPHYLGLYKMAMRTNMYHSINILPVMKDQEVRVDEDGIHHIFKKGTDIPVVFFPNFRPTKESMEEVVGLIGRFHTTRNVIKTVYMSRGDIEIHARRYSAAYRKDLKDNKKYTNWSNPEKRPVMEYKTVLRELLKWADLSDPRARNVDQLREVLEDPEPEDEVVDASAEDIKDVSVPEAVEMDLEVPEKDQKKVDPEDSVIVPSLGQWAVEYAAGEWNMGNEQAAQEIAKMKLPKKISKADFKKAIKF